MAFAIDHAMGKLNLILKFESRCKFVDAGVFFFSPSCDLRSISLGVRDTSEERSLIAIMPMSKRKRGDH